MHSDLPSLVSAASFGASRDLGVRLAVLPAGSEDRLRDALAINRVSLVGIRWNAPGARPLLDFVRENVKAIDLPWLRAIENGQYLPARFEPNTTPVPTQTTDVAMESMQDQSMPAAPGKDADTR